MAVTAIDFTNAGWNGIVPSDRIRPHAGWTAGLLDLAESRLLCDQYIALHSAGRWTFPHTCRFSFDLTQERWNWLAERNFPSRQSLQPGSVGPITGQFIDELMLLSRSAVAA